MRELGHHVYVDNRASARRSSTYLDQINIVIRGRYDIPAIPGALNVLWIISHPELVQPEELIGFDLVYAASESWAMWASRKFGVDVRPLLQATDVSRFRRMGASNVRSADVLVVGNRRWEYERPSAKGLTLLETDLNRGIYGEGWANEPAMSSMVLGEYIDNSELPGAYSGAKVVLNDHHPSMRRSGFINNRIFDALALGTPVISDTIAGGAEVFGGRVKWYESADEIPMLVRDVIDNPWSGLEQDQGGMDSGQPFIRQQGKENSS
jgi:glycosyltransferase involved in cell wall biosynthesis